MEHSSSAHTLTPFPFCLLSPGVQIFGNDTLEAPARVLREKRGTANLLVAGTVGRYVACLLAELLVGQHSLQKMELISKGCWSLHVPRLSNILRMPVRWDFFAVEHDAALSSMRR